MKNQYGQYYNDYHGSSICNNSITDSIIHPSFYLINVVNMLFNETIGAVSGDGNTLVPYLNKNIYKIDHFKHTDYKYRLSYKKFFKDIYDGDGTVNISTSIILNVNKPPNSQVQGNYYPINQSH